ncbi:hypothetical protein BC567DRAFT_271520 [Phyllosticta citribraziliensis]
MPGVKSILPTIDAIIKAVEALPNLESLSSSLRNEAGGFDPSMNVFLLAVSRRSNSPAVHSRTLKSLEWVKSTRRNFHNIWAHQLTRWERTAQGDDPPVPFFHLFKNLDLCETTGVSCLDYSDEEDDDDEEDDGEDSDREDDEEEEDDDEDENSHEDEDSEDAWEDAEDDSEDGEDEEQNESASNNKRTKGFLFIQAKLSKMCPAKTNALESLRMDFEIDTCKPTDFINQDSLKAFEGFALSPHLSKVSLSRFVTSSDCLLTFLRRVSPTLRHLTIDHALLSRVKDIIGDRAIQIREDYILDRDFPEPDTIYTWDEVLPRLRETLSAAPLSSLHLRRLMDSKNIRHSEWGSDSHGGRTLLDSGACDWFAAHQAIDVRDYLLGRRDGEEPPPLDADAYFKLHAARAGCALCGQMVRARDRNVKKRTPKEKLVTFESSLELVRRVLENRCGAGLSDDGVVYDLKMD